MLTTIKKRDEEQVLKFIWEIWKKRLLIGSLLYKFLCKTNIQLLSLEVYVKIMLTVLIAMRNCIIRIKTI